MEEPPPRNDQARPPFDDDPADAQASFDRAGADERPSFDQHVLREELPFHHTTAAERFDGQALHAEPPFARHAADVRRQFDPAADEQHAFDRGWADERAPLDEYALREDLPFDDGADAPPRFADRAPRDESSSDVPAADELPYGDDAADEQPPFGDGERGHRAYGPRQESHRRPLRWREVTQRRSLPFGALAIAIAFVLLAGFGLGVLSGAQDLDRLVAAFGWAPRADESIHPARPSAGGFAGPAEPGRSPQLSELDTVRVAPLPGAPTVERSPGPTASDMPLPPPPKPAFRPIRSDEGAAVSDRIDGVVDAAVAVLEADGAGGPFEPILAKTSVSEPRVFVHYTESAPGSPATALHLVRHLKAAGFTVEGRGVDFAIPEYSIRYFFDSDRDAAEAVSAQLKNQIPGGVDVPILDFTSYEPKPRQGHLEVWLGR